MSLWDPYSHDLYGNAITGRGPTVLRSPGGAQVTADQYLMAKRAYSIFCMRARTSAVTNPVEIGALPDGSQYRIATVGNQTYVDVWPVGGGEDKWFGGIGVSFVNLDGSLIEGRSRLNDDDELVPQPYILTPEVKKGTRLSTGKWEVRKVPGYSGGKAVNTSGNYKLFYTGIEGKLDINVALFRGRNTVNGIAYAHELPGTNAPVYRLDKQVARSRDNPLPFVYRSGEVTKHMQLVARFEEDPGPEFGYHYDLYVGDRPEENETVGELVGTYKVPDGLFIDPFSITLNEAGTGARASGSAGPYSFFDFTFTPDSLSVELVDTVPVTRVVGFAWLLSGRTEVSGTPGQVGYTAQGWTIFGAGDGSAPYGSTVAVDGPSGGGERGDYTIYEYAPDSYIFDRRGRPDDGAEFRRRTLISSYAEQYNQQVIVEVNDTGGRFQNDVIFSSRSNHNVTGTFGTISVVDELDYRETHALTDGPFTVTGGGHSYRDTGAKSFIFEDGELGIAIYYDNKNLRSQEWTWVAEDESAVQDFTRDDTEVSTTFKVVCKGQELLSVVVEPESGAAYQFFLAGDARSGALLINVQEVYGDDKVPEKSWIFIFDDTGGRLLSSIMDLPLNARITSNKVLLTV
jgi:hypothetical protein